MDHLIFFVSIPCQKLQSDGEAVYVDVVEVWYNETLTIEDVEVINLTS